MRYYSTRDREKKHLYSLREAAFMGLAPDGGLFMPESIPQIDVDKLLSLSDGGFVPVAQYVAGLLFGDEIEKEKLYAAVADALDFPVPLVEIGSGVYTLELFHGPTYAFKDVGARFMGRMMSLLREGDERLTILTATSVHSIWVLTAAAGRTPSYLCS
jgi:threonine synthase